MFIATMTLPHRRACANGVASCAPAILARCCCHRNAHACRWFLSNYHVACPSRSVARVSPREWPKSNTLFGHVSGFGERSFARSCPINQNAFPLGSTGCRCANVCLLRSLEMATLLSVQVSRRRPRSISWRRGPYGQNSVSQQNPFSRGHLHL